MGAATTLLKGMLTQQSWSRSQEMARWWSVCLRNLPGQLGVKLRRRALKSQAGSLGERVTFAEHVRLQNPEKLFLGDDVCVEHGAQLNASGEIRMGHRVRIGFGARIWTDNHLFADPSVPLQQQGFEFKPVIIEDDVIIGAKCFIKPGVSIGKGSVLKPGTVLSKSVPAHSVVEGNPGTLART